MHLSLGANRIRLRFSNAYGEDDLTICSATVGCPDGQCAGTGRLQPGMLKRFLTFGGESGITIPAGGLAVSDIIVFTVQAQSNLSISIYISKGLPANAVTSHPGSRTTTWMTTGNYIQRERFSVRPMCQVDHWYGSVTTSRCVQRTHRRLLRFQVFYQRCRGHPSTPCKSLCDTW